MKQKKQDKRKNKRKILLSLLLLLLTFITLSTSTYAWFTANKTVTVSTINVNVAAANGLQISVDGVEWKSIVTNDDIISVIQGATPYTTATNQLPSSSVNLAPVSTVGTIDENGHMQMFLGEIISDDAGNYKLTAVESDEKNTTTEGHFVVFDLFFQVQEETNIYLTNNSAVTAGENADTGIHNAARIAFINEGNVPVGSTSAEIHALKNTAATPIIWEPNYDVHTLAAVSNASSVYGISTSTTNGQLLSYVGVKAVIPSASAQDLNSKDTTYFGAVSPTITTTAAGISEDSYKSAFTIQAGITKMRVYMWVEGQDVDCENNASGGQINFDLQFSSNKNASGTE